MRDSDSHHRARSSTSLLHTTLLPSSSSSQQHARGSSASAILAEKSQHQHHTSLHLPPGSSDVYARSSSPGGSSWPSTRSARSILNRKTMLLGLALVSLIAFVRVRQGNTAAGARTALSSRLPAWRPSWGSSSPAACARQERTPLDPTQPLVHHKYAGTRSWPPIAPLKLPILDILNYDHPRPTLSEQLKEGVRYLATVTYGGHANQIIAIMKMLYLAKITSRVAILPALIPLRIDGGLATPMSTFYDVDRFVVDSGILSVEFTQIKGIDMESKVDANERVSCWSVQELAIGYANTAVWSFDIHDIAVDHWPLPRMERLIGQDLSFDQLKAFDWNKPWERRWEWIQRVRAEFLPQWNADQRAQLAAAGTPVLSDQGVENIKTGFDPVGTMPPTDQFMCYDNTLFLSDPTFPPGFPPRIQREEDITGEDTSWKEVGQFLRFNKELEDLADTYLVDLFQCGDASRIPPFISIHLRRGDFKEFTGFTDLDVYVTRLNRVLSLLQARLDDPFSKSGPFLNNFRHFGIPASAYSVVVTTDEEPGSAFWKEVERIGWKIIDHNKHKTLETYGPWHTTMIDGAVLARGQGFVGTAMSTFSHLAGLRVRYWNGGVVECPRNEKDECV